MYISMLAMLTERCDICLIVQAEPLSAPPSDPLDEKWSYYFITYQCKLMAVNLIRDYNGQPPNPVGQ